MNAIAYILFTVLTLSAVVKLSMMRIPVAVAICAAWGLFAGMAAWIMSGYTQSDVAALMGRDSVTCLGFAETCIFFLFIFSRGKVNGMLGYYPGVMIGIPILLAAYISARTVTGLDFSTIGILTGILTTVMLMSLTLMSRYYSAGRGILYVLSVSAAVLLVLY